MNYVVVTVLFVVFFFSGTSCRDAEEGWGGNVIGGNIQRSVRLGQTKIIAHRGLSSGQVENSIAAFKRAFDIGVDGVELDVWRTIDDSLIIHHDRVIVRNKDSLIIPECSYEVLNSVVLSNGESVPTLRKVLEILPDSVRVYIDYKCCWEQGKAGDIIELLDILLTDTNTKDRAHLLSFNSWRLIQADKYRLGIPLYLTTSESKDLKNIVNNVKLIGCHGIVLYTSLINDSIVDQCAINGIELLTWPVDRINDFPNCEVGGIITKIPDLFVQYKTVDLGVRIF